MNDREWLHFAGLFKARTVAQQQTKLRCPRVIVIIHNTSGSMGAYAACELFKWADEAPLNFAVET